MYYRRNGQKTRRNRTQRGMRRFLAMDSSVEADLVVGVSESGNAAALGYLDIERLPEMAGGLGICTGCFNGKYPMESPKEDIRGQYDA